MEFAFSRSSYRRVGPAGIEGVHFESTMMNLAKDAVVFWRPNEYWLFFWGPLILLNVHLAKLALDSRTKCADDPDPSPS